MLHHPSRFLREQAARPFFLCLKELARGGHMIALLENVLGLLRVWPQVKHALDRLKKYGYIAAKASHLTRSDIVLSCFIHCLPHENIQNYF